MIYALGASASSLSILSLCYLSVTNIETESFCHDIVGGMMLFFGLALVLCFVAAGFEKTTSEVSG
jgi:hypothetical protein